MSDPTAVPYPTLGAAYPVKPVEPPVQQSQPVKAAEVLPPTEQPTEQPKFFPLKPVVKPHPPEPEIQAPEVRVPEIDSSELETQLEPDYEFGISASLIREPQTNSIVLEHIPDALTSGATLTNSGELVLTGSIQLPTTGSNDIVDLSDEADLQDASALGHNSFAPVRSPSVINSKAQLGVLPSKRRRNQGQLLAMLMLSVLIITVGSLYLMAFALGVVK